MVNDTVISEKYDRILDSTLLRKFTYEFGYKNWLPDSSYMLFIKDQAYHFYLSNDTLTLDDRYRDGSYELYLRSQSP